MNRREFLEKAGTTGLVTGAGVTALAATGSLLWQVIKEPENMKLPYIQVDPTKCRHCRRCLYDCLAVILIEQQDGTPKMIDGGSTRCFRCQHCMTVCPAGALSFSGKNPDESLIPAELPSPEKMQNLIRQRRSTRSYKKKNIEPAVLEQIKSTLNFVPTGCNDHTLCFSWSDQLETTERFRSAASLTVIDLIKQKKLPKRIAHFAKLLPRLEAAKDIFFRTAPHFVAISVAEDAKDWYIDPYIAAAQFEMLAVSYGLGTCWGGMATDLFASVPHLLERLCIPKGYKLAIIMLFGYPNVQYSRLPQPEPYQNVTLNWTGPSDNGSNKIGSSETDPKKPVEKLPENSTEKEVKKTTEKTLDKKEN